MIQNTMTKRIILLLILALSCWKSQAQMVEKNGTYYDDAIPVVLDVGKSIFTDVRNTREFPPYYNNFWYKPEGSDTYKCTQGRAIFYRMETSAPGDILIHNWNSRMGFSTIFVYRLLSEIEPDSDVNIEFVEAFEEEDFSSPDFNPERFGIPENVSRNLAYLYLKSLPAGTYFIITAGYKFSNASSPNGELGTTIIAGLSLGIPGEPEVKPEEPNDSPVQYLYDQSGNRIKTIKKQQ